jgi:hypothetical protein
MGMNLIEGIATALANSAARYDDRPDYETRMFGPGRGQQRHVFSNAPSSSSWGQKARSGQNQTKKLSTSLSLRSMNLSGTASANSKARTKKPR